MLKVLPTEFGLRNWTLKRQLTCLLNCWMCSFTAHHAPTYIQRQLASKPFTPCKLRVRNELLPITKGTYIRRQIITVAISTTHEAHTFAYTPTHTYVRQLFSGERCFIPPTTTIKWWVMLICKQRKGPQWEIAVWQVSIPRRQKSFERHSMHWERGHRGMCNYILYTTLLYCHLAPKHRTLKDPGRADIQERWAIVYTVPICDRFSTRNEWRWL
jgi:hypothetical protein